MFMACGIQSRSNRQPWPPETPMTDTSNEHEIRRLVEDWAAAVHARDLEGAVAHHADDMVMFDVPGAACGPRGMAGVQEDLGAVLRQ